MPDIFVAEESNEISALENEDKSQEVDSSDPSKNLPDISLLDKKVHLFSSFCENPEGITFRNQEENEKILLFLRRSMITNMGWMTISFILIALPFFALIFINPTKPFLIFPIRYLLFFASFYYLLVFSYIYVCFITWYYNVSLITNIRIIDIDYSNLVYKDIAITKLNLVQDVSFRQSGVIPNIFNFGDIMVQTAGKVENFSFESAPSPEKAVHIIEDLIGKNVNI